ncbi:RNA demethylase ALKBH10B [Andrographis paniculata]|uniref:RNA demethylase ALKBH10B n=1 Tax=Andrographis paniculata TaxID=175694 RepID=UPI0021E75D67|nr:RNA demethylase ALKBH10B [Andrographis paniculata]
MALQSGAVAAPEKLSVQWYSNQQPLPLPHHQMDERDGLLMWLRGEFAAANAIIDALCHHLRAVGDPGEYDGAIGSIQIRRCNWNPILHMQQYFSVAEVGYALQQVAWRRQQRSMGFDGSGRTGGGGKEPRRGSRGQRGGFELQNSSDVVIKDMNDGHVKNNLIAYEKLDGGEKEKVEEKEEKKELNKTTEADSVVKDGISQGSVGQADDKAETAGSFSVDGSGLEGKQNLEVTPKTFVSNEICEGKSVNIAEGMKFYKDFFGDSDVSKLIALVNDLRAAGRRGQLPGPIFVVSKRPMKGHGREMIQLGVPIADAPPEDETVTGTSKDLKPEPIPAAIQDIVQRLLTEHVINVKPDSCIVDVFNEGDHSQPHIWPQWFGRPVCVLFLTECDMSFGKILTVEHPGDYRGALKLSLSPGSVLVMQGKSADFTRHAIPSLRKQRILVTLVKSQPRKIGAGDGPHRYASVGAPPSGWAPPPSRSPGHIRSAAAAKHLNPIPPGGVLPAQTPRPQLPPPNGIQPIFLPGQVTPGVAFATPVALPPASAGWAAPSPMHPPPRLPLPGTGVFLPSKSSSGSNNSSSQPAATAAPESANTQTSPGPDDPAEGETDNRVCNGTNDGTKTAPATGTGTATNAKTSSAAAAKEEEHEGGGVTGKSSPEAAAA